MEINLEQVQTSEEKQTSKQKDNEVRGGRWSRSSHPRPVIDRQVLEVKRVSKTTSGGRRFSFTSLVLIKERNKNTIAYDLAKSKEAGLATRKALTRAQKKLISYFPTPVDTISQSITIKYKATTIFLKPASPGSGIKAGSFLSDFFKFLNIRNISAKIIGSRNKSNVIRAAFMAMDMLNEKKYVY